MALTRHISMELGQLLVRSVPVVRATNDETLIITNTTPSFGPTSGSLVVLGGLGVQGDIYSQGNFVPLGGIDLAGGRLANIGSPVNPGDAVTLGFFAANAGGVVGGTGIVKNFNTISVSSSLPHVTSVGTIANGTWNGSVIGSSWGGTGRNGLPSGQLIFGSGTGGPLASDPSVVFDPVTKCLSLLGVNESSSSTSGTLLVTGGISTQKSIYSRVGLVTDGVIRTTSLLDSSDTEVGALYVPGGGTIDKRLSLRGPMVSTSKVTAATLNITSPNDAFSATDTTSAVVINGGVSVAKTAYIGGDHYVLGRVFASNGTDSVAVGTGSLISNGGLSVKLSAIIGSDLSVLGQSSFQSGRFLGALTSTTMTVT